MTDLAQRPDLDWPGLFDLPTGPRVTVSAAVARQIFTRVARRFGIVVVEGPADVTADAPVIMLRRPEEFYARVGRDGLIGFGESFMTGAWDSPDLAQLLAAMARDIDTLVPERLRRLRGWYVARHPHHHRNSVDNTRHNIAHHYDLSNDLFRTFLDQTLTYSSALFESPMMGGPGGGLVAKAPVGVTHADLAEAQGRKMERLLDQAHVGPGSRVLEIGTGWGELAIRAARRGAAVHSVTLSSEQRELAMARIAAAGVADRVAVDLSDYRAVRGEYDAVLSIEMIEAVGHEYLPAYFSTLRDRLVPGGRAAIQAIVMPHERMLETLGTFTWIHKYIFPGGFLPSTELLDEVSAAAGLRLADRLSFGQHYAETLRLWDATFLAADVQALGFDEVFRRMWHFYLAYSRAGFASGYLDVQQLVFAR